MCGGHREKESGDDETFWDLDVGRRRTVAVAALDASGAYAELPEIGRCVKLEGLKEGRKTNYSGKYSNKKCTENERELDGQVRMDARVRAPKRPLKAPGTLEPVTLKTPAGTAIECKNSKQNGEYTGANTETDEISLYECTLSTTGETCQSLRPEETPPTPEAGTDPLAAAGRQTGLHPTNRTASP